MRSTGPRPVLALAGLIASGCGGLVATSSASPDASVDATHDRDSTPVGDAFVAPADAPVDAGYEAVDAGVTRGDASDASSGDTGRPTGTCAELHAAEPQLPSGTYDVLWRGQLTTAYCDMTTAGGGFTAFFSGRIGTANTFAHFEDANDHCSDPAMRCLRHLAPGLTVSAQFLATCGDAKVTFQMDLAALAYFAGGVQGRWRPLANVAAASPSARADFATKVWTGDGPNTGFIVSNDDNEPTFTPHTFLSSYDFNAGWNYCNGVSDTSSVARLLVR